MFQFDVYFILYNQIEFQKVRNVLRLDIFILSYKNKRQSNVAIHTQNYYNSSSFISSTHVAMTGNPLPQKNCSLVIKTCTFVIKTSF